jgi:hypothetical protein
LYRGRVLYNCLRTSVAATGSEGGCRSVDPSRTRRYLCLTA